MAFLAQRIEEDRAEEEEGRKEREKRKRDSSNVGRAEASR